MSALSAWILAAALHFAPPDKLPESLRQGETDEQARVRYAQIAEDIADAVKDSKSAKTEAALLLAWAVGETHLAHDADVGPCHRQGKWKLRCDSGQAAGLWQLHEHYDFKAKEKVTTAAIFADRPRFARFALRGLLGSWQRCHDLPAEDRFSGFALGQGCVRGHKGVRARYKAWREIQSWSPPAEKGSAASSSIMSKHTDAIVAVVDAFSTEVEDLEERLRVQDRLLGLQADEIAKLRAKGQEQSERVDNPEPTRNYNAQAADAAYQRALAARRAEYERGVINGRSLELAIVLSFLEQHAMPHGMQLPDVATAFRNLRHRPETERASGEAHVEDAAERELRLVVLLVERMSPGYGVLEDLLDRLSRRVHREPDQGIAASSGGDDAKQEQGVSG